MDARAKPTATPMVISGSAAGQVPGHCVDNRRDGGDRGMAPTRLGGELLVSFPISYTNGRVCQWISDPRAVDLKE